MLEIISFSHILLKRVVRGRHDNWTDPCEYKTGFQAQFCIKINLCESVEVCIRFRKFLHH